MNREEVNKFNEKCVESLRWETEEYRSGSICYRPDLMTGIKIRWPSIGVDNGLRHLYFISPHAMSFHESYDWAMLLVKKSFGEIFSQLYKIKPWTFQTEDFDGENYTSEWEMATTKWLFSFTPHQIAQAALEVLEQTNA